LAELSSEELARFLLDLNIQGSAVRPLAEGGEVEFGVEEGLGERLLCELLHRLMEMIGLAG